MNNIRKYRKLRGMKQIELCKIVGISQGALSGWENGRFEPDINSLNKLADFFGITVDALMGRPSTPSGRPIIKTKIPVYGSVAAGIPLEAITDIEDWEEIDEAMAAKGEYIALRIHGRSMEPRMLDGDIVIVKIQSHIEDDEIGIVFINGDDATCKKVKKTPKGIMLISNNPAYEPMFYSNEEIENLPVRVLGKVVELRGKF